MSFFDKLLDVVAFGAGIAAAVLMTPVAIGVAVGLATASGVNNYINAKEQNTYDYDIVDLVGNKIDVKTKRCNSEPKPHYDCSIAAHGTKQKCDMYVFVRVLNNFSKGWILGKITKDDYFSKAKYHKKGDLDDDNKFRYKTNCYNVKISDLDTLYGSK